MEDSSQKMPKPKTATRGSGFFHWQKGHIAGPVESLAGGLRYGYDKQNARSQETSPRNGGALSQEISEKISLLNESTAKALKEFNESYQENLERLTKIDSKYQGSKSPIPRSQPLTKRETESSFGQHVLPNPLLSHSSTPVPKPYHGVAKSNDRSIGRHEGAPSKSKIGFSPCYLTLKGQLRLGTLQSPFKAAFITYFLSMFLSPYFWCKSILMDIHWHVDQNCHNTRSASLCGVLSLVPGLWFVAYILVAREAIRMEKQNGYQSISAWLAALLGLIPPLAIYYLQRRVNEHWHKHITHVKTLM